MTKSSGARPGDAVLDPVLVALGQRLTDARLDYGRRQTPIRAVPQTEIGRLVGVTGVTVGAWEAGRNDPGVPMLYRLADLYSVRRSWLIVGDGAMRAEPSATVEIEHGARPTHPSQFRAAPEPAAKTKRRANGG